MKKFNELPVEIQEVMLDEQVLQGNKRNAEPFVNNVDSSRMNGGFNWCDSSQGVEIKENGGSFWHNILINDDYTEFYKRYPKKEYPRVMMVSDSGITWIPRVVFMEKEGRYLAWNNVWTIEGAKGIFITVAWLYAKEVEELPTVEVTMEEIAQKFNCNVEQLKIKES